jgi:hypothetical protein
MTKVIQYMTFFKNSIAPRDFIFTKSDKLLFLDHCFLNCFA